MAEKAEQSRAERNCGNKHAIHVPRQFVTWASKICPRVFGQKLDTALGPKWKSISCTHTQTHMELTHTHTWHTHIHGTHTYQRLDISAIRKSHSKIGKSKFPHAKCSLWGIEEYFNFVLIVRQKKPWQSQPNVYIYDYLYWFSRVNIALSVCLSVSVRKPRSLETIGAGIVRRLSVL